jgi:hypothetical protein
MKQEQTNMSQVVTENATHQTNLRNAEHARQIAYLAAGNSQSAIKAADLAYARSCLTSAQANGCATSQFVVMLRELGVLV